MVFKRFATMLAFVGLVTSHSAAARADEGAKTFVQAQHAKLTELLRTAGQGREGRLDAAMEQMVDFEEISRRAFGQPCPSANSNCTNHWNELTEPQRAEVSALLRRLVEKNY